jgi:hypothetical protein
VTTTAEELLRNVRPVKGPNFGVNLDTGNFHGVDPYAELAEVAPYGLGRTTRETGRPTEISAGTPAAG